MVTEKAGTESKLYYLMLYLYISYSLFTKIYYIYEIKPKAVCSI